ncbi:hypothetical protein ATANTOWER_000851 [Ataeniobius toweri]|uniref:Uncharacterized protein n=1 Tax=Ataeniobius toweri TaxID=208326 RepID=A0ABU7AMB1_9TELE|nr:hypothetical protein [Ataeniobius toweri]
MDCHILCLCVSISSSGSIVKAGQPDPTSGIQTSSLPCMRVSFLLLPMQGESDLPSSTIELSSGAPPAASEGPKPADGAPAHSNAQLLLVLLLVLKYLSLTATHS